MSSLIKIISIHILVIAAFGALCSAWINRKSLKNIVDWTVSISLTTVVAMLTVMKLADIFHVDDIGSYILALVIGFLGWGIALQIHKFVFDGELKEMVMTYIRKKLNIGGNDDQ